MWAMMGRTVVVRGTRGNTAKLLADALFRAACGAESRNRQDRRGGLFYPDAMRPSRIRWRAMVGGALAGEVLLVVAVFVWVAFYSYVVNPGQTEAAYRAHADVAAPWVAILLGMPVFYVLGRWWAGSRDAALAMFACYLALDVTLIAIAVAADDSGQALPIWMIASSHVSKLLASQLGAHQAGRPRRLAA
jgi:hypothetical protein